MSIGIREIVSIGIREIVSIGIRKIRSHPEWGPFSHKSGGCASLPPQPAACLRIGSRVIRKVDVRLPGKGNSNSHGARAVHQIISMGYSGYPAQRSRL